MVHGYMSAEEVVKTAFSWLEQTGSTCKGALPVSPLVV